MGTRMRLPAQARPARSSLVFPPWQLFLWKVRAWGSERQGHVRGPRDLGLGQVQLEGHSSPTPSSAGFSAPHTMTFNTGLGREPSREGGWEVGRLWAEIGDEQLPRQGPTPVVPGPSLVQLARPLSGCVCVCVRLSGSWCPWLPPGCPWLPMVPPVVRPLATLAAPEYSLVAPLCPLAISWLSPGTPWCPLAVPWPPWLSLHVPGAHWCPLAVPWLSPGAP